MSPIPDAPRIASVIECKTGSPSECPNVSTSDFILIPPKKSFLELIYEHQNQYQL